MRAQPVKIWGLFLLCLLRLVPLEAQHNNFRSWTVKEGLLQSDIYDLLQDSRGYIWIASGGGVSMFNGLSFVHYTKKNGLSGNIVRCLFEDSKGRIWMGTNKGVCYKDGFGFHTLADSNYRGSTALCFEETSAGNILIGTDDGGLNILNFQKNSIEITRLDESKGLSSNSVMDMVVDADDRIWMATYGGGLNLVLRENSGYKIKTITELKGFNSKALLSIAQQGDELWLGSYDEGAALFSINELLNGKGQAKLLINQNTGLHSNYIWDILLSSDGAVWLASAEDGLQRLIRNKQGYNFYNFNSRNGLNDNQILSLYEDREGSIWIGTNGNGINQFLGDHFSHYNTKDALPSDKIQAVQCDENNNLWLACSGKGLAQLNLISDSLSVTNFYDQQGLTKFISAIATGKGSNKNIWLGTDKYGIVKFDGRHFYNYTEKDGLMNNRVYSVYVDSKGIVWCGTADGISRFDGVKFLNISTDKMKMQGEGVNAIDEDPLSHIWFGTSGGLARYRGEGDLRTFDEAEGLLHREIYAIACHPDGDVFLGTGNGGLYKYNHLKNDSNAIELVANDSLLLSNAIRSLKFLDKHTLIAGTYKGFDKIVFDERFKIKYVKHYTGENGFKGLECNDNAICITKEGDLWLGTINGLVKYSANHEKQIKSTSPVYITDLLLSFLEVDWEKEGYTAQAWFKLPKKLVLAHNQNRLTFKFHSNNFKNPKGTVYKYKLTGRDEDWSPARSSGEETFSGLEPGDYSFQVMSRGEGGDWSEISTYDFTITPPWYRTKVFYISLLILIVLSVFAYIKWRERKLIREKAELEQIVKERTHEVEVQKESLAEKNKEITDSINYAKGIQHSMLPPVEEIHACWKDLFIFFQPKDIVSGDFYWFKKINDEEFLIACADCTGHGVPGGFMSMICSEKLHDACKESTEPAEILKKTNNAVKTALRQQTYTAGKSKDGMEICLLKINTRTQKIKYSGANRLLWVVDGQTKELTEHKPTKASIASFTEFNFEYEQSVFELQKGDFLYTTSDGYPDQFGGPDGKKYMSKNLKNTILQNCHLPMREQHAVFKKDITDWMKGNEQVDDLLLIGIRL